MGNFRGEFGCTNVDPIQASVAIWRIGCEMARLMTRRVYAGSEVEVGGRLVEDVGRRKEKMAVARFEKHPRSEYLGGLGGPIARKERE